MGKRLREYFLYVAPQMKGRIEHDGRAILIDERTDIELDPLDIDDKIKIYERQIREWFLNKASNLMRRKDFGLVGLMVCLSYLEGVQQYRMGRSSENRESTQFFKDSLNRIYPNKFSNRQLGKFYKQVRCGLFHDGMTRDMVVYSYGFEEPIRFYNDTIEVNPKLLLKDIRKDFRKYIQDLNIITNNDLRQNFNTMFRLIY